MEAGGWIVLSGKTGEEENSSLRIEQRESAVV